MSTCNIIDGQFASINGSTTYCGGNIISASYSPSLINGFNRATVTVAGATSTPGGGEGASLSIGDLELDMQVGGSSSQTRVGSYSTMTVNLYDRSNDYLDHSFIFLKEEVPNEGAPNILGRKRGPSPDLNILKNVEIITPASDTVFVDIRKFYEDYNTFRLGNGKTEIELDALIQDAPGKTLYFWDGNPDEVGDTLKEALGDVLDEDTELPEGPYDFQGTFREVISQICNVGGLIAWWDPEKNVVKIEAPSKTATLDTDDCRVIATSSSSDYTTTRAQGAVGTFTSSFPGETQSSAGGEMSRFFKASLLSPTFKVRKFCGSDELTPLNAVQVDENGNAQANGDIALAMGAAEDSKIFAMYALQSALSMQQDDIPKVDSSAPLPGQNNAKDAETLKLNDFEKRDKLFTANKFLANFYLEAENDDCKSKVFAVEPRTKTDLYDHIQHIAEESWTKWTAPPLNLIGPWSGERFENGILFLHRFRTFGSILGDNSELTGDGDILRQYLLAIKNFYGKYYVVRESGGLRSVRTPSRNYGYYVTSNAAAGGQSPQAPAGFSLVQINPFVKLGDCGNTIITDLAKALLTMYTDKANCDSSDLFGDKTVVDFIYALDKNNLEQFFQGGGANEAEKENANDVAVKQSQEYIMYLITPEGSSGVQQEAFKSTTEQCWDYNTIFEKTVPSKAVSLTKKIGQITIQKNTSDSPSPLDVLLTERSWILNYITTESIGDLIPAASIAVRSPRTLPIWFKVSGNSSSITQGSSEVFLSALSLPPEGTWQSSINFGISVNAGDIATDNGMSQTYLATEYDEGFTYSRANIGAMAGLLQDKIAGSTWADTTVGSSESVTYLLVGEDKMPEIPKPGEGLDSIDIRTNNGRTELTVTVGNKNLMLARAALRDLKSQNSHLMHGFMSMMPNVLNQAPNTRLLNIAQGNI